MNKYQKAINQIVKDDLNKGVYKGLTYYSARKTVRRVLKNDDIEETRRFKNWNKNLII